MKAELLHTDLARWELGPYHGALPGPMRLHLSLDGEAIVAAEVETGFVHKGLEKVFELRSWRSVFPYADRVDPDAAAFSELAVCMAVEQICELKVSARSQAVRLLVCELTRISSHLGFIARIARACGADTMIHYSLRDREKLLDLFELISGARFSLNYFRFGGLASDVSEGFLERVVEISDLIRLRLKEYNDVFSFNYAFRKRTCGVGVVSAERLLELGITGPNARAAGIPFDVRKEFPYGGSDSFDFSVPTGKGEFGVMGDSHDRFLVRLREISQSVDWVRRLAESIPPGDFTGVGTLDDFIVPSGEAYIRVESPRGLLGCHLVSDGGSHPCRIQFRTPSSSAILMIPEVLLGARLEDLPVILASLDLSIPEVDK